MEEGGTEKKKFHVALAHRAPKKSVLPSSFVLPTGTVAVVGGYYTTADSRSLKVKEGERRRPFESQSTSSRPTDQLVSFIPFPVSLWDV